jgi:hypothetical protein
MRIVVVVIALAACSCGKENPTPTPGGYGSVCSGAEDCESALCIASGGSSRCSQDCSAAPCPGNDACTVAAAGKVCDPGTPACNSTCSGSVNGRSYNLKCGESSSCLSGKRMVCTESGVKEESCTTPGCTCNTSSTCQAGCSCDPDCPPIEEPKKWGEACSCGAGYDDTTLFCSGTDKERCGMKRKPLGLLLVGQVRLLQLQVREQRGRVPGQRRLQQLPVEHRDLEDLRGTLNRRATR